MSKRLVVRRKDARGVTRFYVLPIESEISFLDLTKFVSQDFGCQFSELDRGPGTLVKKGTIDGKTLFFVLSDSTGTQFFAEEEKNLDTAEHIAKGVEDRLREVLGISLGEAKT
jgi:hypothetical protein